MQKIIIKGKWWRSKDFERKIYGNLEIVPWQENILFLKEGLCSLGTDIPMHAIGHCACEMLFGIDEYGRKITLINCIPGYRGFTPVFFIESVIVGVHLDSDQDLILEKAFVTYINLFEWLFRKPYKEKADITTKLPPPKIVCNDQLEIRFGVSHPCDVPVKIEKIGLSISLFSNKTVHSYRAIIQQLQDFLSFAIGTSAYLQVMQGFIKRTSDENYEEAHNPIIDGLEVIDIYYLVPFYDGTKKRQKYLSMLFTMSDIIEDLNGIIINWLSAYQKYSPVIYYYLSPIYNPNQEIETVFNNYVKGIEVYHRKAYGGQFLTEEIYKRDVYPKLTGAIPTNIEKDFKDHLISTLEHAYEYSLRKRLKQVTSTIAEKFPLDFLALGKSRKNFIERVRINRNFLTHHPDDLEKVSANWTELVQLSEKIKILLLLSLLMELNFPFQTIIHLLKTHRNYYYKLDYKNKN